MFPFHLYNSSKGEKQNRFRVLSGAKHTYYRIIYNHDTCLDEEILNVYNDLYRSINPFDPQSTISKVNRNEDVFLDDFFIEAFNHSTDLAKETNGLFDPTCAPLINLWGFGLAQRSEATPAAIDVIKEYVGYQKIKLNGSSIEKQDLRIQLNFSALGDGFSCEVIARYLDQQGVKDYLIDIGGEIDSECLDQLLGTYQLIDYNIIYLDPSNNYQVRQSYGMSKYMQQKNLSHL